MIGLYTSYVTPIFLRITSGRSKFIPGPFHLGRWYLITGAIAVAWVTFIVVLLLFPPGSKVTAESMSMFKLDIIQITTHTIPTDYAVVIVMAVFIFATVSWVVSARNWFTGPITNIDEFSTPTSTYAGEVKGAN